jgi:hypothetical protein
MREVQKYSPRLLSCLQTILVTEVQEEANAEKMKK